LLLGLARAVTLGSKSYRTHGHISMSHLRLPQLGGLGPRIYIPQEQCGSVIPLGTGFPFCRLLRLSGLRWRYSNPPPHGVYQQESLVGSYSLRGGPHRKQCVRQVSRLGGKHIQTNKQTARWYHKFTYIYIYIYISFKIGFPKTRN
jgi:hypothetical protein